MPIFRQDAKLHYFCHVPKCAGTSVEMLLEEAFGQMAFLDRGQHNRRTDRRWTRTSPQHITAEDLGRLFPEGFFASSFALVRNPLDRLISAYRHAWNHRGLAHGTTIERWFTDYLTLRDGYPYAFDNHLRKQIEFVLPGSKIFKLEDGFPALVEWLGAQYGLSLRKPLERHNASPDPGPGLRVETKSLSREFISRVTDHYAEDYEAFGYDPSDHGGKTYQCPRLDRRHPASRSTLAFAAQRAGYMWRHAVVAWRRNGSPGGDISGHSIW